jgi:hypothetical protein
LTYARGVPVRSGLYDRYLQANYTTDRPGFSYEGVSTASTGSRKKVFQQVSAGTPFQCVPSSLFHSYTLFPVQLSGGVPTYQANGSWDGSVAGDALYRTIQTMDVFNSLGRNGWDGYGSDANIVIRSTVLDPGIALDACGTFKATSGGDPRIPPGGAVLVMNPTQLVSFVASLDQVAHEWGHGVIATTCHLSNLVFDEGFADVIGQIVEKRAEPTSYGGGGVEFSNDWDLGEDLAPEWGCDGCYYFSGSRDDVNGHSFGAWGNYFNIRLHKDDDPSGAASPHDWGNMLNVTFRLMSEGGMNPICTRLWWLSGCNAPVTGVGVEKASRIMFDTIQFYLPSNPQWADLASYANAAAFDRYSNCHPVPWSREPNPTPYDASAEQNAVNKAFGAIGYPRLTAQRGCS